MKAFFQRWLYQFTVGMFFGAALVTSDWIGFFILWAGVIVGRTLAK